MINYSLLAQSVTYYKSLGYERVEAPWLVSEEISNITKPIEAAQYVVTKNDKRKAFVASGEQSFLYMISKGQLPHGKYQTITPCIRNDNFDETHVKYFIKNELIIWDDFLTTDSCIKHVHEILDDAKSFFKYVSCNFDLLNIVETEKDKSYDIYYNGIEIGSYGYRKSLMGPWVYGTGLAEPRFSTVDDYIRKNTGNI